MHNQLQRYSGKPVPRSASPDRGHPMEESESGRRHLKIERFNRAGRG